MASLLRLGLVCLLIGTACCLGCSAVPTTPPAASPIPEIPAAQAGGANVIVNSPEQPCCKRSIWTFLGVPSMLKFAGGVGRVGLARLGRRFPGLEPKPPLTPLTDPSNSGPNASPAQQEAAAVKADQDAAPQKAKGIEFLGRVGCLQYYPDTAKALMAALDDPVEMVRFAAAKALRSANGRPCAVCKSSSCCSREVIEKLQDIGYMTRDDGCWKEPSARVRRMARLAVQGCGCVPVGVGEGEGGDLPIEGPVDEPAPPPAGEPAGAPAGGEPAGKPAGEPAAPPPEELSRQATPTAAGGATAVRRASAILPDVDSQPTPTNGRVLATVNGQPIYWSQIKDNAK
jgi:hypothetical protein